MTREEFLETVAKFGLAHTEYDDFIEVKIKSRYGKAITLMEYCKKTYYSNYCKKTYYSNYDWCCEQEGEVTIYFPQRVLSVDGYLVEIEEGAAMKNEQHKRFSKQTKLERTLTEVIDQLKSWRQEIKLTELEWDF